MPKKNRVFWGFLIGCFLGGPSLEGENGPPNIPTVAILLTHVPARTAILMDIKENLPPVIGIAVHPSPLTPDQSTHLRHIAEKGHDVFAMIPLEPQDYPLNNGGRYTLLTGLSPQDNDDRLTRHVAQRPFIKGIMPFLGGRFLTSQTDMRQLFKGLKSRNLIYIEPAPLPQSVSLTLCKEGGTGKKPLCLTSGMGLPPLESFGSSPGMTDLVLKIRQLGSVLLYTEYDKRVQGAMADLMDGLKRANIRVVCVASFL